MNVANFKKLPVLGILRGIAKSHLEPLIDTVISSGLKTLEITMNTEGAAGLIRQAVSLSKKRLTIGAGTVLSIDSVKEALDAGATFIVSPVLVDDVVEYCVKKSIPVFPGALTPQEIYRAWRQGATMVKIFPSKVFGSSYIKEVKAPLNDIELLACGGVTSGNVFDYFSKGADAVAFGSSIFKMDWLYEKKFDKIKESLDLFLEAVKYAIKKR